MFTMIKTQRLKVSDINLDIDVCIFYTQPYSMCNTRPTTNATPPIAIVVTKVTCGHYWICAKKKKVLSQFISI